jgi:hypothetical protein
LIRDFQTGRLSSFTQNVHKNGVVFLRRLFIIIGRLGFGLFQQVGEVLFSLSSEGNNGSGSHQDMLGAGGQGWSAMLMLPRVPEQGAPDALRPWRQRNALEWSLGLGELLVRRVQAVLLRGSCH